MGGNKGKFLITTLNKNMATIIDGKKTSELILSNLKKEIESSNVTPTLAVIIVGDNKASKIYVKNKKRKCEYVGINSISYELQKETTQEELLKLINELNDDDKVNGILVQLPLPAHIDEKAILNEVNINKDVDCFHPTNIGNLHISPKDSKFKPCTPYGIIKLLENYNINIDGKHCVIIGRSNIVGKPLFPLLLEKNATVTVCHSKTIELQSVTKTADILISAVGKENIITADMVKKDAIIIDVGINYNAEGKLCGDVDFKNVKDIASFITPVPGGVGPMTIAMLMQNCFNSVKNGAVN